MTTTPTRTEPDEQALARLLAFDREVLAATGARVVAHALGLVIRHDAFPGTHVLNELRVLRTADELPEPAAGDVAAAADESLAGLGHRHVTIEDRALGERLAPGLRDSGWQAGRYVVMVLRRPRDVPPEPGLAREVPESLVRSIEARTMREDPRVTEDWIENELRGALGRICAAARARFVAGFLGAAPAAHATIYRGDGIALVEDVATVEGARGHGLARAVVSLAIDLALEDDPELVVIVARADDTPRELYAKLGFDAVGEYWAFTLTPATQGEAPSRRPPA